MLVRRFAKEKIEPKVHEMDEKEMLDKTVLQGLFSQGVSLQQDWARMQTC